MSKFVIELNKLSFAFSDPGSDEEEEDEEA